MNARAVRAVLLVYANVGNQSVTEMTRGTGTAEGFIISFARD